MTIEKNPISDENLRKRILACFAADDPVGLSNLRVGVMNGVVHLAGAVPSIEVRNLAADLAEDVPEVRGVVNRIDAPGAPSPGRTIHIDLSSKGIGKSK